MMMIKRTRFKRTIQIILLVSLSLGTGASTLHSLHEQKSSIAAIVGDPSLTSVQGADFEILTTSNHEDENCRSCPRIFFQAALHGDETVTSIFAFWLYHRIVAGKSLINKIPTHLVFDFLPKANPDNFDRQRYNAHGINLNRNFGTNWGLSQEPLGGSPFSEPETRAIKKMLEKNRYLMAVDIH